MQFHYLLPNHERHTLSCRCVKNSIGILPTGEVTACFWALTNDMRIADDIFSLGKMPEQTLTEILEGERAMRWKNGNWSCQIFSNNM